MLTYAVVEISGRQYSINPGSLFPVDYLGDVKTFECDKVLLVAEDGKLEIGKPHLKQKLIFDVLGTKKEKKIRVATYKAKANTRKVHGERRIVSLIKLRG